MEPQTVEGLGFRVYGCGKVAFGLGASWRSESLIASVLTSLLTLSLKSLKIQRLGKPSIPLPYSSPGTGKLTVRKLYTLGQNFKQNPTREAYFPSCLEPLPS